MKEKIPRVLLVDDDPMACKVGSIMLNKLGCHTTAAHSGNQALDLLAEINPHLILLDIEMPGLSGLETAKKIKSIENLSLVKVVAVTAHDLSTGHDKLREIFSQEAFDGYLEKPLRMQTLVPQLYLYLARHDVIFNPPAIQSDLGNSVSQQRIRELVQLGGTDLVAELFVQFKKEFPVQLGLLKKHLEDKKTDQAFVNAHTLKGSCFSIGLNELGYQFSLMEKSLNHYMDVDMPIFLPKIEHLFEEFKSLEPKIIEIYGKEESFNR